MDSSQYFATTLAGEVNITSQCNVATQSAAALYWWITLLQSMTMTEFWKSVCILLSYGQEYLAPFSWSWGQHHKHCRWIIIIIIINNHLPSVLFERRKGNASEPCLVFYVRHVDCCIFTVDIFMETISKNIHEFEHITNPLTSFYHIISLMHLKFNTWRSTIIIVL